MSSKQGNRLLPLLNKLFKPVLSWTSGHSLRWWQRKLLGRPPMPLQTIESSQEAGKFLMPSFWHLCSQRLVVAPAEFGGFQHCLLVQPWRPQDYSASLYRLHSAHGDGLEFPVGTLSCLMSGCGANCTVWLRATVPRWMFSIAWLIELVPSWCQLRSTVHQ